MKDLFGGELYAPAQQNKLNVTPGKLTQNFRGIAVAISHCQQICTSCEAQRALAISQTQNGR
jgi:hypothetical protein